VTQTTAKPGTEEHRESYMKLVHKQANYCWARMPKPGAIQYDDIVQEGMIVYIKLVEDFDPARSSFMTPFHTRLGQCFSKLLDKAMRKRVRTIYEYDVDGLTAADATTPKISALFINAPSKDALAFAEAMANGAEGLIIPNKTNPVTKRKRVFEFLGIPRYRQNKILNEIREKITGRKVALA